MQIVVMSTRKGGAGKTALAVGLAACWAHGAGNGRRGERVLLIDLDLQGDASAHLGVEASGALLRDALTGRGPLEAAIVATEFGFDLAPAGEELGDLGATARFDALRRACATLPGDRYDRVVVDCAPAMDRLGAAAWAAGEVLLVPVDGPEALRAAQRLRYALEDLRLHPARMRLVLTRYDGRRILDRAIGRQTSRLHPNRVARTTVRESTVFRQAAAARVPLPLYLPGALGARDLFMLAEEVRRGSADQRV